MRLILLCLLMVSQVNAVWTPAVAVSNGAATQGAVFAAESVARDCVAWVEAGSPNTIRANIETAPGLWSQIPDLVATSTDPISDLSLAISTTGIRVLVWKEGTGATANIYASSRTTATNWGAKVLLSNSIVEQNVDNPKVSINATGVAIAVWQSSFGANNLIRSSLATALPAWGASTTISTSVTPLDFPQIALAPTGSTTEAIALFGQGSAIRSLTYNGTIWSLVPTTISIGTAEISDGAIKIAADDAGAFVAAWPIAVGSLHALQGSFYDQTLGWSVAQPFSGNSIAPLLPQLSLASTGDGVIAWELQNGANVFLKQARILPAASATFGPIQTLATFPVSTGAPLVYISDGAEAIASWKRDTGSLEASSFPADVGGWTTPQFIANNVQTNVGIYLDGTPTGTAVFQSNGSNALFASQGTDLLVNGPLPPTGLRGIKNKEDRFLIQSVFNNILLWTASLSDNVVSYQIFRDGVLIGVVLATDPLQFIDKKVNRLKNYLYSVVAIDDVGLPSNAVSITL